MKELYKIILEKCEYMYQLSKISYFKIICDKKYFYLFQNYSRICITFSRKHNYERLYNLQLARYIDYDYQNCNIWELPYGNLFITCCRQGYIDIINILLTQYITCQENKYITMDTFNITLYHERYETVLFLLRRLLYFDNFDKLFQTIYVDHRHQYKILKLLLLQNNVSPSTIFECLDRCFDIKVYHLIIKYNPHLMNRTLKRRYQKYLKMR